MRVFKLTSERRLIEIIIIILYLATFAFLLRFLSAIATKTVFKGVNNSIYSIIFLILIYGTLRLFYLKLFLITLISGLVVFGIIRFYADKLGMREDNSESKRSILISIAGLIIVLIVSFFINNI